MLSVPQRYLKRGNDKQILLEFRLRYGTIPNAKRLQYEFIQNSKIPTMHFQKSLPRLPIPKLEDTCSRYLKSLQPLLTAEKHNEAVERTNNFLRNDGQKLDELLKNYDNKNKHSSYISDMWFDMYLRDRRALPINFNPIIVFQRDDKEEYNNQLIRACNLLISSVRFMLSLRAGILNPEVYHLNPKKSDTNLFRNVTRMLPPSLSWYGAYMFKAFPLDMSQYMGLFGSTRIPLKNKDKIVKDETSKHILVQRRGRFYIFDVLDINGALFEPTVLLSTLKKILDDDRPFTDSPVGIFTTLNRDNWATQRERLVGLGNSANLQLLDTAIFNLILDDDVIQDDKHKILRHYVHGDGTNRWFDKSLSMIVTGCGHAGLNFEHSWGDGVAVLRYFEDILKDSTSNHFVHPSDVQADTKTALDVKELDFRLDNQLKQSIHQAKHDYEEWCKSLSIDYILYEELGKSSCKSLRVSPDMFMQLGFQAAHHLLHGTYVGTYESCSTAAFKHGRTETMRPCTMHTKEFCDSIHSRNRKSNKELKQLLHQCSSLHGNLAKEAAMGQGFDRHLFALNKMASMNNIPVSFFSTYEYELLNKFIISTSTLSSPYLLAGAFGPVEQSGYAIAYSVFENMLGAAVISYSQYNSSDSFVDAIRESFKEIKNVLETQD